MKVINASGELKTTGSGGGGGMSYFDLDADSGSPEAITNGEVVSLLGGDGIASEVSAPGTVTFSLETTAVVPGDYLNVNISVDEFGRITAAEDGEFHDPVTLDGSYDYLTISGQIITLHAVDLTADVSGILPLANGGTGADLSATGGSNQILKQTSSGGPVSVATLSVGDIPTLTSAKISDFQTQVSANTDVAANTAARHASITFAGTPDYITLSGQVITRALINLTTHVTGVLPNANVADDLTISGGTVNNSVIGGSTPAAATVTTLTASSGLVSSNSATPVFRLYETDGPTDQKYMEFYEQGGIFVGTFVNDAHSVGANWLEVYRNSGTYTVGLVLFPAPIRTSQFLDTAEISTPSTPPSGYGRFFTSTSGVASHVNDAGTVTTMGGTAAASCFHAYSTSDQTPTLGVTTKLTWTTEDFDTNGWMDIATNHRFTPLVAGYYLVYCSTTIFTATSTGGNCFLEIQKNGSSVKRAEMYINSGGAGGFEGALVCEQIIQFNGSTDYVEVYGNIPGTGTGQSFYKSSRRAGFGAEFIGA